MKHVLIAAAIILALVVGCIVLHRPSVPASKVRQAKTFCRQNSLNEDICIFVDFSQPRVFKRLYIYDLRKKKIIHSSLCPTGMGKEKFSNVEGSHLSSLGKYEVTSRIRPMSIGFDGIVIKGLDKSNSNAEKRLILIHSYTFVNRVGMFSRRLSWGCFVVDKKTFKKIRRLDKPLLLWAYEK